MFYQMGVARVQVKFQEEYGNYLDVIEYFDGVNYSSFRALKEPWNSSEHPLQNFIDDLGEKSVFRSKSFIYFHHLSYSESLSLVRSFYKLKVKPQILMREGQIYYISLKKGSKQLQFRDSFLHLGLSLSSLSFFFFPQSFKGDLKLLYEILGIYNLTLNYLFRRDITYSLTLPSFSFKIFRERFFEPFYEGSNLKEDVDRNLRASYGGGMVDIYIPSGTNLVALDVNSLYPFIMATHPFGMESPRLCALKKEDLEHFCGNFHGFVYVRVKCHGLNQPLIPFKFQGKNIQASGAFMAMVPTPELCYCLQYYPDYYSFEPLVAYYYMNMDFVFKDYMTFLYRQRKSRDASSPIPEGVYKNMMNSLSGRLGIKHNLTQSSIMNFGTWIETASQRSSEITNLECWDDIVFLEERSNLSSEGTSEILKSRVDGASMITSLARCYMQRLKDRLPVYYMDTDSIVVDQKNLYLLKDMIGPHGGQLKIVGFGEEAVFVSPKVYAFKKDSHYYIKMKGVKGSSWAGIEADLFRDFKESLHLNTSSLEHDSIIKGNLHYDKRIKLYDSESKGSGTKPLSIFL